MLKKLREVMPKGLSIVGGEYEKTRAFTMLDEIVLAEHGNMFDQLKKDLLWPGTQKNVHFWVELGNGFAVGWNENPTRGWSFPVIKNTIHHSMTEDYWNMVVKYYKEKYKG